MGEENQFVRLIYEAIDEINDLRPEEENLEKAPGTSLFGESSKLDSLGLVNLIVAVEEKINDEFDLNIVLADEKAMSQENSPFQTVTTLADFIAYRLKEESGE